MSNQKTATTRRSSAKVVTPVIEEQDELMNNLEDYAQMDHEAALAELDAQVEPAPAPQAKLITKPAPVPQVKPAAKPATPELNIVFAEEIEELSEALKIKELSVYDEAYPRAAFEKLDWKPGKIQYVGDLALLNRKIASVFTSIYTSPEERAARRTQSQQQNNRFQGRQNNYAPRELGSTARDVTQSKQRSEQDKREAKLAADYQRSLRDGMTVVRALSAQRGYTIGVESLRNHDLKNIEIALEYGGSVVISTPVSLENPTFDYRSLAPYLESGQLLIISANLKVEEGWSVTAADRNHEMLASMSQEVYVIQCTSDSTNSGVLKMAQIAHAMGTKVRALSDQDNPVWKRMVAGPSKVAESFYLQ